MTTAVLRYAAFTVDGRGGNPAGLVLDATGLDATPVARVLLRRNSQDLWIGVTRSYSPLYR